LCSSSDTIPDQLLAYVGAKQRRLDEEMMMPTLRFSLSGLCIVHLVVVLSIACLAQAPTPEPVSDQETELGMEVYKQLRAKGEIIESSPLYDNLKPIAEAITRVAQPRYPHPFKFFLVHETQPNAFATPGGNVYVVDSLLYFVKNTEQLAGTLCHEVSHTIHRDGIALMEKEQRIEEREVAAAILLGPTRAHIIAIALIGKLHSLGYSREAESKADVTGADICASASYNPWGLPWLFRDFQNADPQQIPQLLSDHPGNGARIRTLERHFRENPDTFSRFSSDPKTATPFTVPKNAPAVFLRTDTKGGK
jgi:predicted Zn-dependent protease